MEEAKKKFKKDFKATLDYRDFIDTILFYQQEFRDDFSLLEMADMMTSTCRDTIFKILLEIEEERKEEQVL